MLSRHPDSIRRTEPAEVVKTHTSVWFRCWCCCDSGLILIENVQEYLISDFRYLDVPMVCKFCTAASERFDSVFDRLDSRASVDQCQKIHQDRLKQAKSRHDSALPVAAAVQGLADLKTMAQEMPRASS